MFNLKIAGTHNPKTNPQRKVYEEMKTEPAWADILKETGWMHYKTVHKNIRKLKITV